MGGYVKIGKVKCQFKFKGKLTEKIKK